MAVFRILEAKARPGAVDRLTDLLVQQERSIVAASPGAVFAQSLRSGDQVLAVSSWETRPPSPGASGVRAGRSSTGRPVAARPRRTASTSSRRWARAT